MPFGEYDSFEDCVAKNQDKENPEAYCAEIKKKVEGQKLAGCYDSVEQCVEDQVSKGKPSQEAYEIALYFAGKGRLSEKNLVMIRPDMNFGCLPDRQIVFYNSLLPIWEKRKKSDFSKEEIEMMLTKVRDEIKKRELGK